MSAKARPPVNLVVPVVDGDNPAEWRLWDEKTLEKHVWEFYTNGRYIPSDFEGVARLMVAFQPEEKLLERNEDEWKAVVGILVDANGDPAARAQVAKRVLDICKEIAPGKNAWYRELRFRLGLVLNQDPPEWQPYVEFGHELQLHAETILDGDVEWQLVSDVRTFHTMMRTVEQQLVYRYMKRRSRLS